MLLWKQCMILKALWYLHRKSLHLCCLSYLSMIKSIYSCTNEDVFESNLKIIGTMFFMCCWLLILSRHREAPATSEECPSVQDGSAETQGPGAFGHATLTSYLEILQCSVCLELFPYLCIFVICFECVSPCHCLNFHQVWEGCQEAKQRKMKRSFSVGMLGF